MRIFGIAILALAILIGINSGITRAEHVLDSSEDSSFLSVISGKSGSFTNDTLTLKGVSSVVYFSDRPGRTAGHISLADFARVWADASNNFGEDHPNATLSILSGDGAQNAVIELVSADVKSDSVSFDIKILQGKLPEKFGASSIFIDGIF